MDAMEIVNYGCVAVGYQDYVPMVYDEMLRYGKKIFCIGTDDNHNRYDEGSVYCDSFGGFTVIKAESLTYENIINALEKGNFYTSQGPEIKALWFEDGKVHIECSGARRITANYGVRKGRKLEADGELLTSASFGFAPDDNYIRITVEDENGLHANTNAYFADEVYKD